MFLVSVLVYSNAYHDYYYSFSAVIATHHMMAQSTALATAFIYLAAVQLIITLSYCSVENVYCVTPTATSCSSCPQNTNCATLSEYAQEAKRYFTSDTTMVFLPGDHTLDTNITVVWEDNACNFLNFESCSFVFAHQMEIIMLRPAVPLSFNLIGPLQELILVEA